MRRIAVAIAIFGTNAAQAQTCPGETFVDTFNNLSGWSVGGEGSLSSGNGSESSYQGSAAGQTVTTSADGLTMSVLPNGNNPIGAPFTGAMLSTQNTFSQTYGYFEATMTIPPSMLSSGMTSAFWLLGYQWPPEIDIEESQGTTMTSSVHASTQGAIGNYDNFNFTPGQHTFGVNWTTQTITFYEDGQQTAQVPTPSNFDVPMYMVLDAMAGPQGGYLGNPMPGASSSVTVQRVRVFDNLQNAQACDSQSVNYTTNSHGSTIQQGQDAVQASSNLSVSDIASLALQGLAGDGESTASTIAAAAQSVKQVASVATSSNVTSAQPIVLASDAPSGTMPAPPPATTSVSINVSGVDQTLTEPAGNGKGTVSGTGNTLTAISGAQMLDITGTGNTILTGPYNDSVTVEAPGNVIDLGAGSNTITLAYKNSPATTVAAISSVQIDRDVQSILPLAAAGNVFVAPQPGMGVLTIQGNPMSSNDEIDLTKALAGVAGWDHQLADLPQFVTVSSGMTGTAISIGGRSVVVLASAVAPGNVFRYLTAK